MKKTITVLLILALTLVVMLPLAATGAHAGYYCDLTKTLSKYTPGWYGAWIACVFELIMESESGKYW